MNKSKKLFITSAVMFAAGVISCVLPSPKNDALKEFKENFQTVMAVGCAFAFSSGSNKRMKEISEEYTRDYQRKFSDRSNDLNL